MLLYDEIAKHMCSFMIFPFQYTSVYEGVISSRTFLYKASAVYTYAHVQNVGGIHICTLTGANVQNIRCIYVCICTHVLIHFIHTYTYRWRWRDRLCCMIELLNTVGLSRPKEPGMGVMNMSLP